MDEDRILNDIRRLTTNDDIPIESILKQIIGLSCNYLYKSDIIGSSNKGIIPGNILSLLHYKGATYAMEGRYRCNLEDNRIGPYPYDSFILHADYSTSDGWRCSLISSSTILTVPNLDIDSILKDMVSSFDIKYGMFYSSHTSLTTGSKVLLIIPSRGLISIKNKLLYVNVCKDTDIQVFIPKDGILALPAHVLAWLYPPL